MKRLRMFQSIAFTAAASLPLVSHALADQAVVQDLRSNFSNFYIGGFLAICAAIILSQVVISIRDKDRRKSTQELLDEAARHEKSRAH